LGSKSSTQAAEIVSINTLEAKQGDPLQIIFTINSAELTQVKWKQKMRYGHN